MVGDRATAGFSCASCKMKCEDVRAVIEALGKRPYEEVTRYI